MTMMSYYSGKFLFKWSDFWQNIGSLYHDLSYNQDFYDVTLVDEDFINNALMLML